MSMLPMPKPVSYRDPLYERLAREAEMRFKMPQGILDAIRTMGERSNANQVSEAGARSVYQFIPETRRAFIKKYGVDPWKDPLSATTAAAQHLVDDFRKTGSWDQAITRYHGGPDPRRWGPRTKAYGQRVGSFDKSPSTGEYYEEGGSVPDMSRYTGLPELGRYTEPPKEPVPVSGDPGPSVSAPASSRKVMQARSNIRRSK